MKKRLLKAITALILSISVFLPAGDLPLSVSYSAYAAESKSVAAPAASRESGTIYCMSNSTTVKLSSPNSKAEIYYSLNGGEYKKYSSAIKLTKNATIKAYAKLGGSKSSVVTYKYKLTPSINFNVADTSGGKLVKLTTGVSKVKFYYTIDGSTPTTKSKLYTSSGIKVTENCTLRVLAVRSGWTKGYYSNDITAVSKINTDQLGDGNFLTPYMSGSANVRFNGKYLEAKARYWRCVDDNKKYYDTVSVTISEGKSVEFNIAQDHKFNTGDTVKSWQTGMGVSDVVLVGFDLDDEEYNLTSNESDQKYFDKAELKAVNIDYTGEKPSVLYFYVLAHDNKGNEIAVEGMTKVLINNSKNIALSGSSGSGSSGNAGGSTGGTQPETPKGAYTSPNTGKVFTIPDKGFATITYDGEERTVPAENKPHTPDEYYKYDNNFHAYLDGSSADLNGIYLYFAITEDSSWTAGKTLGLSDMRDSEKICVSGIYKAYKTDSVYSDLSPKVFRDAQFTIIERNASTGLMKWYFYVEIAADGTSHTFEGVAHTVRGEAPRSVGGSTEENTGGNTGGNIGGGTHIEPGKIRCGVCFGKGKVKCSKCTDGFYVCTSCHGVGTYWSSAQKRDVICPRCRNGKIRCTICNGTGYKRCGSCGGDGYR